MIPRRVYTSQGIIVCPLDLSRGHTMIPRRAYTSLRSIPCPLDHHKTHAMIHATWMVHLWKRRRESTLTGIL